MPLRQPLVYRRWQQKTGVAVDQAKVAHARMVPRFGPAISCPRILPKPRQRGKSDGLLDDVWQPEVADGFAGLPAMYRLLLTTRNRAVLERLGAAEHELG